MDNYYQILNVSQDASSEQIKKSYRSLSMQYHPDRNTTADPSIYQKINEAYEILGDDLKKKQYDMQLKFGFIGGNGSIQDELNDINNIINMMFGGSGGPVPPCPTFVNARTNEPPPAFMNLFGGLGIDPNSSQMPNIKIFHTNGFSPFSNKSEFTQPVFIEKPEPVEVVVTVNLYEVYHGCIKEIQYERTVKGNYSNSVELMKMDVTIFPCVNNEHVYVFEKKGDQVSSDVIGDLNVIVEIEKDSLYEKRGLDLIYKKNISLKESLCGFSFDLKHLSHKILKINNQNKHSIVNPGDKKTIPKYGFIKENQTGNLIIEFSVQFPKSLTTQKIELLKDIL